MRPESAPSRVERLDALYTAVVSDVLDKLGFRDQCFRADVRPLYPGARLAGVALTVQTVPADDVSPAAPYQGELAAVDALRAGDVMVVSSCEWSYWGELLSTAARYRGCRGVVIDGYTRDRQAIRAMDFAVFCRGTHPADSLGRLDVSAHNVPVVCAGVRVHPGDLILADDDGIVAVPSASADEVLGLAEEKVRGENTVRDALAAGMPATEAFRRFGIL